MVEPVRPDADSLFAVKARRSIFFQTPPECLPGQSDVGRLVPCGQVTEQCVLYSAIDAHIRHVPTVVAPDAVAPIHPDRSARPIPN